MIGKGSGRRQSIHHARARTRVRRHIRLCTYVGKRLESRRFQESVRCRASMDFLVWLCSSDLSLLAYAILTRPSLLVYTLLYVVIMLHIPCHLSLDDLSLSLSLS
jgi:hypothetical protein